MAATTDDLRKNITPGSLPFGQRQGLEQSLGQVGQGPASPAAAGAGAQGALGIPSNPLDPLMGGELEASGEVTDGLSVGPGTGPQQTIPASARVERLRLMSLQAKSPILREAARRALRSTVKDRRGRN